MKFRWVDRGGDLVSSTVQASRPSSTSTCLQHVWRQQPAVGPSEIQWIMLFKNNYDFIKDDELEN